MSSWCLLCRVFPQCRKRIFRRVCGIGRCLSTLCCYVVWLSGHEGVLVAVGAALESDEPSVADGAVDEGGGHVLVTQDASPSGDFDVGDVDDAPSTNTRMAKKTCVSEGIGSGSGSASQKLRRYYRQTEKLFHKSILTMLPNPEPAASEPMGACHEPPLKGDTNSPPKHVLIDHHWLPKNHMRCAYK